MVDENLPMTLFDFSQVGVTQAIDLRALSFLFSGSFKYWVSSFWSLGSIRGHLYLQA